MGVTGTYGICRPKDAVSISRLIVLIAAGFLSGSLHASVSDTQSTPPTSVAAAAAAVEAAAETFCKVTDARASNNLKKIEKAVDCLRRYKAAHAQLDSLTAPPTAPPAGDSDKVAAITKTAKPSTVNHANDQNSPAAGQTADSSAYLTPSACDRNSTAPVNLDLVAVRRELLAPREASDDFGYRLGRRFFVYQVRVTNRSPDFQYVVNDITVDLYGVLKPMGLVTDGPETRYLASSRELNILRGVPEKGMDYDPRNMTLHIFQGIGTVAGGISGLTTFSDVMGSAVAAFSGPFISSFINIAPDHTASQLNRLSDSAFASNTLVDKLQTKVFSVFIPEDLLLSRQDQKRYWSKTRELLDVYPFDQLDVCVDGTLTTPVAISVTPTFSNTTNGLGVDESLTLTAAVGATIYYTTNGQTPTTKSTPFATSISFNSSPIGSTQTVQAIAVEPSKAQSPVVSYSYTILPSAPIIKPSGTSLPITLAVSDNTAGATLLYTDDGNDPTTSPTAKAVPGAGITLDTTVTAKTIKVVAQSNNTSSKVTTYIYPPPAAATPTFSPAAGTYTSAQTVAIADTTTGAVIYYTADGTPPSTTSTKYTVPVAVAATGTINTIAIAPNFSTSAIGSAAYTINISH